jgi:hypothetical protein
MPSLFPRLLICFQNPCPYFPRSIAQHFYRHGQPDLSGRCVCSLPPPASSPQHRKLSEWGGRAVIVLIGIQLISGLKSVGSRRKTVHFPFWPAPRPKPIAATQRRSCVPPFPRVWYGFPMICTLQGRWCSWLTDVRTTQCGFIDSSRSHAVQTSLSAHADISPYTTPTSAMSLEEDQ